MEIKEVQSQITLMVRLKTASSKLPEIMGEVYGELAAFMEENKIQFAGPPYARYYNMDMEALDVEMGFPVTGTLKTDGRIQQGDIPGGKIVTAVHTGSYSSLEDTYNKLMVFAKEEHIQVEAWMYEFYLNSPLEVKPEELQTQICFPVV